jgi:hypothetical protein
MLGAKEALKFLVSAEDAGALHCSVTLDWLFVVSDFDKRQQVASAERRRSQAVGYVLRMQDEGHDNAILRLTVGVFLRLAGERVFAGYGGGVGHDYQGI